MNYFLTTLLSKKSNFSRSNAGLNINHTSQNPTFPSQSLFVSKAPERYLLALCASARDSRVRFRFRTTKQKGTDQSKEFKCKYTTFFFTQFQAVIWDPWFMSSLDCWGMFLEYNMAWKMVRGSGRNEPVPSSSIWRAENKRVHPVRTE